MKKKLTKLDLLKKCQEWQLIAFENNIDTDIDIMKSDFFRDMTISVFVKKVICQEVNNIDDFKNLRILITTEILADKLYEKIKNSEKDFEKTEMTISDIFYKVGRATFYIEKIKFDYDIEISEGDNDTPGDVVAKNLRITEISDIINEFSEISINSQCAYNLTEIIIEKINEKLNKF